MDFNQTEEQVSLRLDAARLDKNFLEAAMGDTARDILLKLTLIHAALPRHRAN